MINGFLQWYERRSWESRARDVTSWTVAQNIRPTFLSGLQRKRSLTFELTLCWLCYENLIFSACVTLIAPIQESDSPTSSEWLAVFTYSFFTYLRCLRHFIFYFQKRIRLYDHTVVTLNNYLRSPRYNLTLVKKTKGDLRYFLVKNVNVSASLCQILVQVELWKTIKWLY